MIIVVKKDCEKKQLDNLIKWVKDQGLGVDVSAADPLDMGYSLQTQK